MGATPLFQKVVALKGMPLVPEEVSQFAASVDEFMAHSNECVSPIANDASLTRRRDNIARNAASPASR